jgi:hypothetical protein
MKKQNNHEDNIKTESLADLPLTNKQTEETKAGSGGGGGGAGKVSFQDVHFTAKVTR